jgi:hypothetical protein
MMLGGNRPTVSACSLLVIATLAAGLQTTSGPAWAKHHKTEKPEPQSQSSDPCAALNTSLQARIGEIRTLKAAVEDEKHQTPNTVEGVIELFSGQSVVDREKEAKLADLRREADTLNSFLKAQGCKTVDVDQQLAKPH